SSVVAGESDFPHPSSLTNVMDGQRFRGRNPKIGEVGFFTRISPQGDAAREIFAFEAIHNKTGRIRTIEKKARRTTMEFDLDVGPGFWFEVGPRFVDRRPLPAQRVPVVAWLGDILDRVITHGLIVGEGIARAEIEHVVVRTI